MIAEVDYLLDDIGLDNYFEEGTTTIKAKKRKPTTKRKKNVSIALISERLRWENTLAIDNNQDIQSEWDPNNGLPHTGKWPIEEERFAHKLIQQFENGLLDDVEDGTTLRSYLAKTLKCIPMRISKKFAGKCVGSKTYVRNRELDQVEYHIVSAVDNGSDSGISGNNSRVSLDDCVNHHKKSLASNVIPKYSLRKHGDHSYNDDYHDDETSSTMGDDVSVGIVSRSSRSSSDCVAPSDQLHDTASLFSLQQNHNYHFNKRPRNMDHNGDMFSFPARVGPVTEKMFPSIATVGEENTQDRGTSDYFLCHLDETGNGHEEWNQALSLFCTDDVGTLGISSNGSIKLSQSTNILNSLLHHVYDDKSTRS